MLAVAGAGVAATLLAASLASRVDPPANDLILHGTMVRSALEALRAGGWSAFQDPWCGWLTPGYPMFRVYPHLAHQGAALVAWVFGLDPWTALGLCLFLGVAAQPAAVYLGARALGWGPRGALLAAGVAATMRCVDPYGHTPLSYSIDGPGLYAQLWGMDLATVALPCALAACRPGGAGLARLPAALRIALAAGLLALTIRTHLPSAWIAGIGALAGALAWGPAAAIPARLARLAVVVLATAVLAAGFLVPFVADLGSVHVNPLEAEDKLRSIGALPVLRSLLSGAYLDGGHLGPWTAVLLLGGALAVADAVRRVRGRGPEPAGEAVPLVLPAGLAWLAVVLLFGRATWGAWVDDVPLVGRFHDHRYLLGLHLVFPWLAAGTLLRAGRALRPRLGPRAWPALLAALVAGVAVPQGLALRDDLRLQRDLAAAFAAREAALRPLLEAARAPGERWAMGTPDPPLGGARALDWLRSRDAVTFGTPLQHYAVAYTFNHYAVGWYAGEAGLRQRAVTAEDLVPAGVTGLLIPPGWGETDAAGVPWSLPREAAGGGWRVARPAPLAWARGDAAVVRADLLMRGARADLDGFQIAWFQAGLHRVRQFPAVAIGEHAGPDPACFARHGELEVPDGAVLLDLPATGPAGLGRVRDAGSDPRTGAAWAEVTVEDDGAWVVFQRSWHPGWQARLDGASAQVAMLVPGLVGVPVPPGAHRVEVAWPVSPGRGAWAAGITALYAVAAGWLGIGWVRRRRIRTSGTPSPR